MRAGYRGEDVLVSETFGGDLGGDRVAIFSKKKRKLHKNRITQIMMMRRSVILFFYMDINQCINAGPPKNHVVTMQVSM